MCRSITVAVEIQSASQRAEQFAASSHPDTNISYNPAAERTLSCVSALGSLAAGMTLVPSLRAWGLDFGTARCYLCLSLQGEVQERHLCCITEPQGLQPIQNPTLASSWHS